jgi:hypothetical protein
MSQREIAGMGRRTAISFAGELSRCRFRSRISEATAEIVSQRWIAVR